MLQLDSLKLRNEELEADLEILKEEMASGGSGGISEGNSVQLKQLELQNERLKEALIKYVILLFHLFIYFTLEASRRCKLSVLYADNLLLVQIYLGCAI